MSRLNRRVPARPHDAEAIALLSRTVHRDERTGCLLWTRPQMGRGYGRIGFRNRNWTAHRLSYHAHYGPIPKGLLVCHKCDVRACIAVEHLFLGTPQENTADMLRKGRGRWRSLLTVKQVVSIKRRLLNGESCRVLAEEFGISVTTVMSIKHGRNWGHVRVRGEKARAASPAYDNRIPILEFSASD